MLENLSITLGVVMELAIQAVDFDSIFTSTDLVFVEDFTLEMVGGGATATNTL